MVSDEGKVNVKWQVVSTQFYQPGSAPCMEKEKSTLKGSPWPGNILKSDIHLDAIRRTGSRFLLQRAARQHSYLPYSVDSVTNPTN